MRYHDEALAALRISTGLLFGYFGALAVFKTQEQFFWLASWVTQIPLIGTPQFVFVLGVVELLVALALIVGFRVRLAALVAAALLVGIIVNLGFGEVALRDTVILLACLVLASSEHQYTV